jgi:hypothetical protein
LGAGKKHWFAFLLILSLAALAFGQTPSNETCNSTDASKIVRTDDRAERVFVEARLEQINTLAKAQKVLISVEKSLKKCRPNWSNSWSASFFSDRKYAGYKHDSQMEPFVEDGSWFRSYVGEYDRKTEKLTLNPTDPKKVKFLKIRLP